jgi:transposase
MEAMRSLKRRLSDLIYKQMTKDARTAEATGPGGHTGATLQSSAASSIPTAGTSEQSLPGPATSHSNDVVRDSRSAPGIYFEQVWSVAFRH